MTNHPNRSKRQIAIMQYGYAFYGVGKTLKAAIEHANNWTDDKITKASLGNYGDFVDGEMVAVEVTPELAKAIREDGQHALAHSAEISFGVYGVEAN